MEETYISGNELVAIHGLVDWWNFYKAYILLQKYIYDLYTSQNNICFTFFNVGLGTIKKNEGIYKLRSFDPYI